jgi:hypothetical protein
VRQDCLRHLTVRNAAGGVKQQPRPPHESLPGPLPEGRTSRRDALLAVIAGLAGWATGFGPDQMRAWAVEGITTVGVGAWGGRRNQGTRDRRGVTTYSPGPVNGGAPGWELHTRSLWDQRQEEEGGAVLYLGRWAVGSTCRAKGFHQYRQNLERSCVVWVASRLHGKAENQAARPGHRVLRLSSNSRIPGCGLCSGGLGPVLCFLFSPGESESWRIGLDPRASPAGRGSVDRPPGGGRPG